ncbi:MAG: phosphotransferase [Gammaproteobacteria bacterium]|nr:phosphotransferase [Gammaproteobacteria bacterium]MDH3806945.1 phosphotransferase [Gammaproteobacteria bacterium]
MADEPDPLQTIALPPPNLSVELIGRHVGEEYGLDGELVSLVSERDQNFRLTTESERRYVVKIANSAEHPTSTDFQIQALLHMEKNGCGVAVPRVIPTLGGAASTTVSGQNSDHTLRVVSYLPGRPLDDITIDSAIAGQLGRCLAEVDLALRDFEHPGDGQPLLWDMRRAAELRGLLPYIEDGDLRATIRACLNDFEKNAAPKFASLRSQVIHNDVNPGNVLVTEDESMSIAGVIDFGDMIRAPLIIDVAIAASYMRSDDEDASALIASLVAGYDDVIRLEDAELELLHDLVRMRLATTIAILHLRLSARAGDDAYTIGSLQGEQSAGRFLARINAMSRSEFADRMQKERGG